LGSAHELATASPAGVLNSLLDFIVDFGPHPADTSEAEDKSEVSDESPLHLSCRFLLPQSCEQARHCGLMLVALRHAVAHRPGRFDPFSGMGDAHPR